MNALPVPPPEAVLFEDERLYVCLASFPLTRAHTVVVWKGEVEDLHLLSLDNYEYLMDVVEVVRNALRTVLGVEKVYLMYMDEVHQVHWHLVPRYDEKGMNVLMHTPQESHDFSDAEALREAIHSAANEV